MLVCISLLIQQIIQFLKRSMFIDKSFFFIIPVIYFEMCWQNASECIISVIVLAASKFIKQNKLFVSCNIY